MKKRAVAVLAGAWAIWLVAQNVQTSNILSTLFPGGALVYIEARDLSALLRDWNSSAEKRLWLTSHNYEVFSRTRLFLRLAEAQQQFAETAGFAPDMTLVNSVTGAQSAIGVYDLGELEFLYVTRLPSARVMNSTPFQARNSYEGRESVGIPYYVRSGANRRVAAFGTTDGWLFLGTRSDLVANALALYAKRQTVTSLAQDRWFDQAARAATTPGEVRLVLNMPALLKTPYFRSYWVQRNASQLRPFSTGVVDLFREATQVREERVLIRESQVVAAGEQAVAQVVAWVPPDTGLYRAWAAPPTDQVLDLIRTKLVAPGMTGDDPSRSAPAASNPDAVAGDASDLETRIDQPPFDAQALDVIGPMRSVVDAATVQAMLHVQSSRPSGEGVFVGNDCVIGLLAASDWPAVSIPDLFVHRLGRMLLLANSEALLQRVVAQLGVAAAPSGAAYAAHYSHAREFAPFVRMMTQIDAASTEEGGEPRLFSENVATLGRALNRVESASIIVHDDGLRVTQKMVYRLKQ